ncbi:VanW family protein [Cellulomonas iranensis]|uniref:Vancomycin resistance protein YoaR n=1 Tax=Cellulomonas iranensis TaxID=76862 RepID=A0ABU0GIH3_9CELL|nr:VanW family protein [Cellulomonas iranensis]MDQ0424372.1 vancomycin resistance protein YoaR [Cellulomonas iranensis]
MTHGTDRDGPDERTAGDAVVPGPHEDGVSVEHADALDADAQTAGAPVREPADGTATGDAPADVAPADVAPADAAPVDAEPVSGAAVPDEVDAVPAPAEPADAALADDDGEDPAPAGDAPEPAVRRSLAPEPAAPLTAWPSWDDVAVTAPPADEPAPDASERDGSAPSDDVGAVRAAADDVVADHAVADHSVADHAVADRAADDAPGAAPSERQEESSAPATEEPAADGDAAPAAGPLDLSALAFAALNAAAVGVPAHALPRSPLAEDGSRVTLTPEGPASGTSADPATGDAVPAADAPDGTAADVTAPTADAARDDTVPEAAARPAVDPAAPAAGGASDATTTPPDATAVLPPVVDDDAARTTAWPATAQGAGAAPGSPGGPVVRTSVTEREGSPLDGFDEETRRRRWPRALAIVGGVVVLLAAGYVGASYALADRVPRGATVAGVEIGGMTADEAEKALVDGLADRTAGPVPVVAQDVQAELDPATAGLALDAPATVARLTGVDLTQPVRLWRQLVGVREQPPVSRVDDTALEGALTELSGSLVLAPVDGTVVFADGAPHATEAVDGWDLDVTGAADVLADGWLTQPTPVELPTTVVEPAITQAETDRVLTQVAQPLAAAPVTVQVADRQATLDVATLTANASFAPVDGTLELQLDGQALTDAMLSQLPDLLTTASDARFEFQDGAPVIVPGVAGTTLDPAGVASAVATAATSGTGNRLATVDLVESDPAETTAALEALGVKEVVSEFSTPLTSEPRRTSNISTGLRNITGTLVRPGETFSLTEALGPVDAAHGFVQAGAIVNGEHADAWGGGLSQVSTTTYNAAYFAGFEDVEHTPHSEWFQRYPEGREATIFTGVIDMKWKNNTPYGALVQGYVADGRATVRIWSTKHFTVETEKSGRSGVVSPTTVYSQSATCQPQSAGNPGFTVTNTRRVYLAGELVDTESRTWRYKPQNRVVCGSPPAPGAPATP